MPKIGVMLHSTSTTHPCQGDLPELERPLEVPKVGDMNHSTQHLPIWIFARGVTQGSGQMKTDAQVISRSKLLKSGRTIGGA